MSIYIYLTFGIFFSLSVVSTLGYGFLFKRIFFNYLNINAEGCYQDLGNSGLLGIIFLSFLATFFHFFFPLGEILNFIILLIGTFLFYQFRYQFRFSKLIKYTFTFLFFLSLLMIAYHKPYDDYGGYHLPYLINLISEKVIFGLSNLQVEQGWNSMWLNFTALFNLPALNIIGFNIANSLFFIFFNICLLELIFTNYSNTIKSNFIIYTSLIFLSYFLVKFARLNSFGTDVSSNMLIIYSYILYIKFFFDSENFKSNYSYSLSLIVLCITFSFMIKLSNIFAFLLVVFIFCSKKNFFLIWTRVNIFCFFFILVWLVQQYIYTGCIFYPFPGLCYEDTSWLVTNDVKNFYYNTAHVNKLYRYYIGGLSPQEYSTNYNWLYTWFINTKTEIIEHILTLFIIGIISFAVAKKKYQKEKIIIIPRRLFVIVCLSTLIATLAWFHAQPTVRYGLHYFEIFLVFGLLYFAYNRFASLDFSKLSILIVISLSLIFNIQKNIFRINNDRNKNYTFFYTFPSVKFEKYYFQEFKYYMPANKKDHCWNQDFLCSLNKVTISKWQNYYFIKKANQ